MIEIIPAINADSFEEIARKLRLVEPHVAWAHLDVADGTFTKNTIWHNAADLQGFETPLLLEAHLMIGRVEDRIGDWLLPNIKRLIFHTEAAEDPDFIIKKCREAGKEVGISLNPETPWTRLHPHLRHVDLVQILGVHPGLAGQRFQPDVLHKIESVRESCPRCIIEVDGGMNAITAKQAVESGADIIVAASAIFGRGEVGQAVKDLRDALA